MSTTRRVCARHRYLAGDDAGRAAELHALFANPEVKAIFCCRGGYGSQRLLPYLDTALITTHPKIFMGSSDLTYLLLYLYSQCQLIAFHGPVVAGGLHRELTPAVQQQLKGILLGDMAAMQPPAAHLETLTVLHDGDAAGRLLGGGVCRLCVRWALGTPVTFHDTIVFLEDRGERLSALIAC